MKKEHEKNELDRIINTYNFNKIKCVGKIDTIELSRVINNLKDHECPDAYSIVKDVVYIIEHFEFDSFKNNKKGSQYKNEIAKNKRQLEESLINGEGMISGTIESESSFGHYVDNFIKHFDYHYNQINKYIENIKQEFPNIKKAKVWFFAEDMDDVAPMINNAKTFGHVCPLCFKRVQDYLSDKNEIDGIVIGASFGDNTNRTLFIKKENFNDFTIFEENESIVGTKLHYIISQYKI